MTTHELNEVAGLAAGLLSRPVSVANHGTDAVTFRCGPYTATVDLAWAEAAMKTPARLNALAEFVVKLINQDAADQHEREQRARGAER